MAVKDALVALGLPNVEYMIISGDWLGSLKVMSGSDRGCCRCTEIAENSIAKIARKCRRVERGV